MTSFEQHILDSIGEHKVDLNKPFILITSFKTSGKYYDTYIKQASPIEINLINKHLGDDVKDTFSSIPNMILILEGYNFEGFFHYLIK